MKLRVIHMKIFVTALSLALIAPAALARPKHKAEKQDLPPIFEAIAKSDAKMVRKLLKSGASVGIILEQGSYPTSPLHQAASGRSTEIVKLLLDAGANPNEVGHVGITPLMKVNDEGVGALLLAASADVNAVDRNGESVLMHAVSRENINWIQRLLDAGAKVNYVNSYNNTNVLAYLLDKGDDDSSRTDTFQIASLLLVKGVDPLVLPSNHPVYGQTYYGHFFHSLRAFHYRVDADVPYYHELNRRNAAKLSSDKLKFLLSLMEFYRQKGIDIQTQLNQAFHLINPQDLALVPIFLKAGVDVNYAYGNTGSALVELMRVRYYPLDDKEDRKAVVKQVETLLDHGADINAVDRAGRSALMLASYFPKDLGIQKLLLERGVKVNQQDGAGRTALHYASSTYYITKGNPEAVKALLAAGANPRIQDQDGETAMDQKPRGPNAEVMQLLRDATAQLE